MPNGSLLRLICHWIYKFCVAHSSGKSLALNRKQTMYCLENECCAPGWCGLTASIDISSSTGNKNTSIASCLWGSQSTLQIGQTTISCFTAVETGWERLSFLPRDTEETVAESRWEPKSLELQCCVLIINWIKIQQGILLVVDSEPSSLKTSGGRNKNQCWCSFSPWSLGEGAEEGRIQLGRILVSFWAEMVSSGCG